MKLSVKLVLTAAVLAMAFSTVIMADDYAGESMAIGVGARPLGMGGTFAAIADDASTSYWNPAGMYPGCRGIKR
jgi:long-subunit fatty acid transport protein